MNLGYSHSVEMDPPAGSVICSVWAIGGLILLSLGVIGEYIGKIYLETKQRPRFLIRTVLEEDDG